MKDGKLTQKEENFILNLLKGMNQTEAYLAAGYAPGGKIESAYVMSCRLAGRPKIQARLIQLRTEATQKLIASVASVDERKQTLTQTVRAPVKQYPTHREKAYAISELNKMEHIYEIAPQIDNRHQTLNIIVKDEQSKQLLDRLVKGE